MDIIEYITHSCENEHAVVCENDKISYAELDVISNRVANNLVKKGVLPQDVIILYMERGIEYIIMLVAVLKVGASFLPVDFQCPVNRLEYIYNDSSAKMIVSSSATGLNVMEFQIRELLKESTIERKKVIRQENFITYIIYTSGTTGKPKGVRISDSSVINLYIGMNEKFAFFNCKKILASASFGFDMSIPEVLLSIMSGLTVVMTSEKFGNNIAYISNIIKRNNIDILQITPSRLKQLMFYDNKLETLKFVDKLLIGADVLPKDLLYQLQDLYSGDIYNLYGPTEATVWATVANVTKSSLVTVGKELHGVEVFIQTDTNEITKNAGITGEILISGAGLAVGYINDEKLNKRFFFDEKLNKRFYRTGDHGYFEDDGNLICLGRNDRQIKKNGYRIELQEIENVISDLEDIKEVVVVCTKEDEKIVAYYTTLSGTAINAVGEELLEYLPEYMIPDEFVWLKKIPLTTNGKVDRKVLQIQSRKLLVPKYENVKYANDIINIICQDVDLNIVPQDINLEKGIKECGIDSIQYVKIIISLEEKYAIEFSDDELEINFFPTIGNLIDKVKELVEKKNDF